MISERACDFCDNWPRGAGKKGVSFGRSSGGIAERCVFAAAAPWRVGGIWTPGLHALWARDIHESVSSNLHLPERCRPAPRALK